MWKGQPSTSWCCQQVTKKWFCRSSPNTTETKNPEIRIPNKLILFAEKVGIRHSRPFAVLSLVACANQRLFLGKGLIILLHGAPGVGKTTTAG